jgi:hypothetical protein
MLAGVYYGSTYGGSTASILLNLPGTPSAAVACLDGYPMAKQGRAGVALFMTTIASFVGGSIGIIIMMLFSPMIVGGAAVRPGRIFRDDGARPGRGLDDLQRLAGQGHRHGGARDAARHGRHRRQHRRAALHLRHPGTV